MKYHLRRLIGAPLFGAQGTLCLAKAWLPSTLSVMAGEEQSHILSE